MFRFMCYGVYILVNVKSFYIVLEIFETKKLNIKLWNSTMPNIKISILDLVLKIIVKEIVTHYLDCTTLVM